MKVSPKSASLFLAGKVATGTVTHYNELKESKQNELRDLVSKANSELNLNDTYDSALSTPETAGAYINKIQTMYDAKAQKDIETKAGSTAPAYIPSGVSGGGFAPIIADATEVRQNSSSAAQKIKSIIVDDIIDKVSNDKTLTKEQKVQKVYKLTDANELKNIKAAVADAAGPSSMFDINNVFHNKFSTLSELGGNQEEEKEALNSTKAGIEYKVNNTIKNQIDYNDALKSSIIEEYNSKVAANEIDAKDPNIKKSYTDRISAIDVDTKNFSSQYATDKQLFKKYPVLEKAAIANAVNEYNAIKSGNVVGYEDGGYENVTLPEYLQSHGFDISDQKVQDFVRGDNFKDYSFFGRPVQNIVDVFTNTAKSLGDFGFRNDLQRLGEKKQSEIFTTQVGDKDEFKLTEKAKIGQNVGNTTGQVIGQGLLQAGTAGLGRMAGLTKLAATNAAFWSSGSLGSYDAAYKDSYDFIDSGLGRTAYAGLIALSNAASEKIFPDIKLFQIPGVQDAIADLSKKIGTKEFTAALANETMGTVKKAIADHAKHFLSDVAKETVEEVTTQLFEDGLRFISGDPNANFDAAMENAKNTAIQTATGMLAIGAYGAHKSVKEERNTAPKAVIYNAALYHDEAMDAINKGFEQKLYSNDERNEKIKTLNTAQAALKTLEQTQKIAGKNLSRPQKELYVANLTAEALLTQQAKEIDDTVIQKSLEEKISNLQNQRKELLDGKVEIDEDGNIVNPENKKQNEKVNNTTAAQAGQGGKNASADKGASTAESGQTNPQENVLSQEDESAALQQAKEIANSGTIKGFTADALKEAANNDEAEFKDFLKSISEQAQDPRSLKETVNAYGQPMVDIANKLFPAKTSETSQQPSTVKSEEAKGNTLDELNKSYDKYENDINNRWEKESEFRGENGEGSAEYKKLRDEQQKVLDKINDLTFVEISTSDFEKGLSENDKKEHKELNDIRTKKVALDSENLYKPFKISKIEEERYKILQPKFEKLYNQYKQAREKLQFEKIEQAKSETKPTQTDKPRIRVKVGTQQNEGTANETTEPLQQNEPGQGQQGDKGAVQQGSDGTGQPNAERTAPVRPARRKSSVVVESKEEKPKPAPEKKPVDGKPLSSNKVLNEKLSFGQKYTDVQFNDPVSGEQIKSSAKSAVKQVSKIHEALEKLVNCLTK